MNTTSTHYEYHFNPLSGAENRLHTPPAMTINPTGNNYKLHKEDITSKSFIHIISKKGVVILFLMMICVIGKGQSTYFNNIYQINNSQTYGVSLLYKDSIFYSAVVFGKLIDSNFFYRIALCKTNSNANLFNSKSLGWGSRSYYLGRSGCFQQTSDNCFFVVGYTDYNSNFKPFLVKVNDNFDTLFFKEYIDTTNNSIDFKQGKETFDKGFIMVGTKYSSGLNNADIFILKTDSLGNEEWRKIINLGGWDFAQNVIQTPDKGFLIGCYYYSAVNNLGDGCVLKLDSIGNVEWSKMIGGPKQDGVPIVVLAKDSNYIVATSYAHNTLTDGSKLRIQVVKMNKSDGSFIWDKQYGSISFENHPKLIKSDNNDDLIIIGTTDYSDSSYFFISWLLKINQNGDSLLYRHFYKNNSLFCSNNVNDFCITEDKSIVTCGLFDNQIAYSWLAKMDSLGCLQPGCQYVGIEELQKTKAGELKVYPNPATTQTTITYPIAEKALTLQIYNMLGQLVYEEKLQKGSSQTTIKTTGFKPGLYKVVAGERNASLIIN